MLQKHMKACGRLYVLGASTESDGANDVSDEVLSQNSNWSFGTETEQQELFQTLPVIAPTLPDTTPNEHRGLYLLSPKHLETIKFLGCMSRGMPVAEENQKEMLKYVRSLVGTARQYLPKIPKTAWRRLAKVTKPA